MVERVTRFQNQRERKRERKKERERDRERQRERQRERERQRACSTLIPNTCTRQFKFLTVPCVSVNNHKCTVNIDFDQINFIKNR